MDGSVSSKHSRLKNFLQHHRFNFVTDIQASYSSADLALFVSGDFIADRADKLHTSWRQLKQLQKTIQKKLKISIEWIVTPGSRAKALETALFEILQARFPKIFVGVYVSSLNLSPLQVWLEPAADQSQIPGVEELKSICTELFQAFDLKPPDIIYSKARDLPSNPMLLRCVKTLAPASVDDLVNFVQNKGFMIPSHKWLHTKLDTMRRKNFLVFSEGRYALTELALAEVPHSKTRTSSDVERVLSLGRRKWY